MKKLLLVLSIVSGSVGMGSCCRVMDCCFDNPCTTSCPEMLKCPKSCSSSKQTSGQTQTSSEQKAGAPKCNSGKCSPQNGSSQQQKN